jgi:MoaA/NifB/PqqE/SkfB family radical SAM enzyme
MGLAATVKTALRDLLLVRLRWPAAYEAVLAVERRLIGRRVGLEANSACQLACPLCVTAHPQDDWRKDHGEVVGRGSLALADFERILDGAGKLRTLELSNWGEIFLNKQLVDILRVAHERGIAVTAANGVNLNHADDEVLEALVRYGVKHVVVSIDGATQQSYERYRARGDLARVLGHVDRINHFKAKHGSELPKLTWRLIVFGHNEHELAAAKRMAAEHQMAFTTIKNLDDSFSPVQDPERVERETGVRVVRELDDAMASLGERMAYCSQMWDAPQINWDGKLLGCCCNDMDDFGNVLEQGLEPALKSERYVYAKRMLLGLEAPRDDIPCVRCPVFAGTPHAGTSAGEAPAAG